jgi:hypothetical protein
MAPAFFAACSIPGMGAGTTDDQELLLVPRRVNYNVYSDPFYSRTDVLVYKSMKDGTLVLVPISKVDKVGIIINPSDDPDEADEIDQWLDDPQTGSYAFQHTGRYDIVVTYKNYTMTGRYSVWAHDPVGVGLNNGGGIGGGSGGGNGGGISVIWGN